MISGSLFIGVPDGLLPAPEAEVACPPSASPSAGSSCWVSSLSNEPRGGSELEVLVAVACN